MVGSAVSKGVRVLLPPILRGWIVLWVLAVPLFHVHPEADQRHGDPGHIHGGTVHTVFSGDLEGEFGGRQEAPESGRGLFAPPGSGGHEYGELGFSLLHDSTDRKSGKPHAVQAFCVPDMASAFLRLGESRVPECGAHAPSIVAFHDRASRAPPAQIII